MGIWVLGINSVMHKIFKGPYPHFNDLKKQVIQISNDNNLDFVNSNPHGQLAVQTKDTGIEDWTNGIGKVSIGKPGLEWEMSFRNLQRSLIGTPLDDYLNWLGVNVYRTRIMMSRSKTCYSIHKDHTPRLHLPIVTNPQCNFLITEPELNMFHLPASGETVWVDTTKNHTFLNGSNENRLHLVMIVEE